MLTIDTARSRAAGPLTKLAVSQRFLPHYRVGFFDHLNSVLGEQGCSLRLFYSYTVGEVDRQRDWAQHLSAFRADLQLAELEDSAVFAPGLLWNLIQYAPDVVVLEDLGGILNSLAGSLYCRLWKRPYLIWGLGQVPQKRRSRLRRLLRPLIRFLYGGAFGFVCYSTHASAVYSQYGKPTYLAPNSSVPQPSRTEVDRVEREILHRSCPNSVRVISIGILKPQKRYDVLLRAVAQMPDKVTLDLVGDGPEMSTLKELASTLGIAGRVVFHGPLYEPGKKSRLLFSAHIGVMPGRGGLAIQEMMRHGVPVISGVADGTEQDLIRDRHSGYLIDGFPSPEQISERMRDFLALTSEQQVAMARAALEVVAHKSNTETMVQGMEMAVKGALNGGRAGHLPQCVEPSKHEDW
jgi:glycosyltransferase involved in cell wall biosynthesis